MSKRKVIILNGPPGSGKDTIADEMCRQIGYQKMEFKERLHALASTMSGISRDLWDFHYSDREKKDQKWVFLRMIDKTFTPREYMIYISERIMKPIFGADYFGKAAMYSMDTFIDATGFVFSDGGFSREIQPMIDCGNYDVKIVQLYRDGCSFENDSRDYINIDVPTIVVTNNKTIKDCVKKILKFV